MKTPAKKTPTKKPLYPYTLQPIALNLSDNEFKAAQLALFQKTAQNHSLTSLKPKEWGILGVITVLAVVGLVMVSGYSTILFWLMLIGVAIYLVLRTLGLNWYMQKEYEKQVASTPMPSEMHGLKIGVQAHGLIMTLPNQTPIQLPKGMVAKSAPTQQAVIPWTAVQSWDETDEFLFIMFEIKGQKGSQIIPKRAGLPIDTIKNHLSQITAKGLPFDDMAKDKSKLKPSAT